MKLMCKTCFHDPEIVCVPEAPLLNIPEAAPVAEPLLKRFEAAGEEYADTLNLSLETKKVLETPMIPKKEYLKGVNG